MGAIAMAYTQIPLVPGPVTVPQAVREARAVDYGSADLEDAFFELYAECARACKLCSPRKTMLPSTTARGCWHCGAR